jgi:hypothetical protein
MRKLINTLLLGLLCLNLHAQLATDISQLDSTITILDLTGKNLKTIPPSVF